MTAKIVCYFSLLICIYGCGSTTFEETNTDVIDSSSVINLRYADRDPRMNSQGDRVVYISGDENSKLRVHRYDVSEGSNRTLTHSNTSLEEVLGRISPDGSIVAYVQRTKAEDNTTQYSLHTSSWDAEDSTQIFPTSGLFSGRIDQVEFEPQSRGLALQVTESGTTSIYVVKLSDGSSTSMSGIGVNPKFVTISSSTYLVTENRTSGSTEFKFYDVSFVSTPSLSLDANKTTSVNTVADLFDVSSSHLFYEQLMDDGRRTKERLGDVVPNENGSLLGYQSPTKGIVSTAFDSASTLTHFDDSEYLRFDPLRVWGARSINSDVTVLLGSDRYICNNASISVSTILFYSNTASSSGILPLLVTKDPSTNVVTGLSSSGCGATLSGVGVSDQPIVNHISAIQVNLLDSGEYRLLIESRDADDGEIYLLTLRFSNFTENEALEVSTVNVSSNLPE